MTVRDEGTTDDGAVFLVMDLLKGQTLSDRLEHGAEPFSVGEVLDVASQLLDVLVQAHDRGIVHRDIKPENVFLTHERRVKLLDFGIARVETATRTHATEAGTTLGTPAFMPPEQALGRWTELDGRSDLWSLGATMYLLLSGLPVREPGSVTEQLLGAMTRPVPSLGAVTALPRARSWQSSIAHWHSIAKTASPTRARCSSLSGPRSTSSSTPDSRATLPPPSIEPMALSLRTPRPEGRFKRPSIPTVRPLAANVTPLPRSRAQTSAQRAATLRHARVRGRHQHRRRGARYRTAVAPRDARGPPRARRSPANRDRKRRCVCRAGRSAERGFRGTTAVGAPPTGASSRPRTH